MKNAEKSSDNDALFEISTVARLTGLSAANIRMWEKRYNVVEPARSKSGRRLYTENDVSRLTLLKSLADHGQPIRTTFSLSDEDLSQRLRQVASTLQNPAGGKDSVSAGSCRVVIVGHNLVSMARADSSILKNAQTVAEFDDLESAEAGGIPGKVDLLVVESPALFEDTAERIRRLLDITHALRAIVVYHFAQSSTVEVIEGSLSRITAIRAPVSASELRVACSADIALANRSTASPGETAPPVREYSEEIPERNFTDRQIADISQVSSAIDCECPHHLAGLLTSLLGFEQYSRECENRNAADAEIHAYLHKTTAHARAVMEDSLRVLVEFEGIEVND